MIENILPLKFNNGLWIFKQYGQGKEFAVYAMKYILGKTPAQIMKQLMESGACPGLKEGILPRLEDVILPGFEDAELTIYYDLGKPNICHPHWRGTCLIDPKYDSKEFREKLIDHLLEQKIVERPVYIGSTWWDKKGEGQGRVAIRYTEDGQDIWIGGD
jgi:hypothetical protein